MQVFQALVLLLSLACLSYSGAYEDTAGRKLLQTRRGKPNVDDVADTSEADDQLVNDYGDIGSSPRRSSPISDTPVSDNSTRRSVGPEGSLPPPSYVDRRGRGNALSPPPLVKKESKKALPPPPAEKVDNPFLDSDLYTYEILIPSEDNKDSKGSFTSEVVQEEEPFNVLGAGLCRGEDITGGPTLGNHYTVDSGISAKQCQDACFATGSCIGYAWGIINFVRFTFPRLASTCNRYMELGAAQE